MPAPAPGAELLVLAGDIDSSWSGLSLFRDWPVPVIFVAGNHEFDERELTQAWPELRARCTQLGMRLLECESLLLSDANGKRIRFVATTRWSDFDLFGAAQENLVEGRTVNRIRVPEEIAAPSRAALDLMLEVVD